MTQQKRNIIFQTSMTLGIHVNFQGCNMSGSDHRHIEGGWSTSFRDQCFWIRFWGSNMVDRLMWNFLGQKRTPGFPMQWTVNIGKFLRRTPLVNFWRNRQSLLPQWEVHVLQKSPKDNSKKFRKTNHDTKHDHFSGIAQVTARKARFLNGPIFVGISKGPRLKKHKCRYIYKIYICI